MRIEKLVWIQSDSESWINSDRFSTDLYQTRVKTFFGLTRMNSDWLGYRIRNKSDWFQIHFDPKLLPGKEIAGKNSEKQ